MNKPYISCDTEIEIPFHDIDMMDIAWHGHYTKYLEISRGELLELIDYNYPQMKISGYAWPIIELHIRYAQPLKFKQKIRVHSAIIEIENRLKINYTIFDVLSGKRLTRAHTVQVAITIDRGEMLFASPDILINQIKLYS